MPHIFLPSIPPSGDVEITGETARYMLSVLRLKPGDVFSLFDGKGGRFRAEIKSTGKKSLIAQIKNMLISNGDGTDIVLLQGLLKGQKMDLVVQKATELGVKEIVPLITERSQLRETRKLERWQKIAVEASRQCGRTVLPEIKGPAGFDVFFNSISEDIGGFIFWEEGGRGLKDIFANVVDRPVYAAIGPEGGFTEREVGLASAKGLVISTLGKRILRAETAAISALAVIQFLSGGMSGNME